MIDASDNLAARATKATVRGDARATGVAVDGRFVRSPPSPAVRSTVGHVRYREARDRGAVTGMGAERPSNRGQIRSAAGQHEPIAVRIQGPDSALAPHTGTGRPLIFLSPCGPGERRTQHKPAGEISGQATLPLSRTRRLDSHTARPKPRSLRPVGPPPPRRSEKRPHEASPSKPQQPPRDSRPGATCPGPGVPCGRHPPIQTQRSKGEED